ncbi:MAG TPA: 4Fe-4S dicluster domain-containing protein [Desulfitobacterium dehalogenans]|uniref:4Fe-4S dicluster domain-containing protein n=1 Tax=Desulfitobacterium dehalogenans TaxID=36854 RepID=A0A7C7D9J3_9FIRM|nr:4Fe-4S dicluster domain-containing protein [Desulfitobacterium dehalogenans]
MANLAMLLDMTRCAGCYGCVVSCKMENGSRPGINYNGVQPIEWGEYPNANQRFRLTLCNHCEDPECVSVCPAGATTKSDNGAVLVDHEKCIGCGMCVSACPYGQRHLVKKDETNFPGEIAPYEEESVKRLNVVEKCTYCNQRVSQGLMPACVQNCPGKCRIFGDVADPESEISKYITTHNAIKVEGTSTYYVIPENMDEALLPAAYIASANAPVAPPEEDKSSSSGIITGVAVATVAAVAVGVGVGVARSRSGKGGDDTNG